LLILDSSQLPSAQKHPHEIDKIWGGVFCHPSQLFKTHFKPNFMFYCGFQKLNSELDISPLKNFILRLPITFALYHTFFYTHISAAWQLGECHTI
jgi:hypothetical protein